MDTKYAFYSTSKGYRVLGGTAAHFLKADGSLDNTSYLTTDTIQNVTAVKSFITSGGSGWTNHTLRITSNDGSNPGLTFYKTGVDAGVVNYDGLNDFRFRNSNDTASKFIFAQGYKKDGSDDNSFLTAGGGSVLRSTYPTTTQADAKYFPKTNVITITTDLNTLILEGVYYGNLWVNNPIGYNTISTVTIKRYSQDWIAQEFRPITNASKVFIRNRYNGTTWTDWKEIITSDAVTGYVPYTGATSDLTLTDKNLNLTTGSLSKYENGLRVFNKVFHKAYSNVAQIGIISFKFPQATTSATMFTVDINYHEYNSRSLGKLRVAFYKQTATILHTSGRAALWEGTDNLPSTIINIGIDLAGNVCINLGEITTNWGTYAHFEIERVQTSYSGVNTDWSKGWSQTTETVAPVVPDTYQSLVNIVPEIVATRTFIDTNLIGSIPKSSSSLGTADLNTVLTAGFYQQLSTSNATIANNYPATVIGYLNVYRVNTTRIVQEYTEFTNLTTYKRSYNGSTWSTWIESGITTTTNQTGLSGNKTTSGAWNFSGVNASPITLQRLGNTSNNSIAFGFDTPSMYAGMADAGNFAIGSNANLLSTPNRKFWIDFAANSVNAPGQIGGSTLTSKDLGGFTINTTTNVSKAEMILRHVWSANNQTFGVGGTSSATAGSMSEWGMYKWLNNRTVNGKDGFFGWVGDNDTLKATSLAGTGIRMVTADSVGTLSTQTIPDLTAYLPLNGGELTGALTIRPANSGSAFEQDVITFYDSGTAPSNIIPLAFKYGTSTSPTAFIKAVSKGMSGVDGATFQFFDNTTKHTEINSTGVASNSFIKSGGLATQFLKADGSIDSNTYSLSSHTHTFTSLTSKPTTATGYGITDVPRQGIFGGDINSIRSNDTRNTNPLPSTDLKSGAWFDFKGVSTIGLTSSFSWASVMTFVPYSDDSGNANSAYRLAQSGDELSFQNYTPSGWGKWRKIWTNKHFSQTDINNWGTAFNWGNHDSVGYLTNSALSNYYTKNESLNLFVRNNGVETISDTKTFTHSPVIPNGTLDAHAVNVSQLNTKANGQENASAVGFSSGNIPTADGGSFPYMYHNSGSYVALATQSYVQTNFLSTPNGTSVLISGSNLNDYLKTGFYRGVGLINAPFNNNGWWYVIIETHDSTWVTQKATSFGSGNIPNVTYQRTMNGGSWSDWAQVWTTQDFTTTNIQQWNYAYQYGLKVNETFSVNMSSGMAITDGILDNESGLTDLNEKNLVSAKRGYYYKYGSSSKEFEGLNYEYKKQKFGLGREINDTDKLTVEGSVKASKNFKSEGEKPDTLFIPNGELASLRDEIVNDQSDYAIRLDPHEYEIDPSGSLEVDDRNRLIHIIGEQVKMTVNFRRIYPKQQIVIYNFDQNGATMTVKIQGKTIANINARGFLRLYITKSLRVIAERQQPCDFIW